MSLDGYVINITKVWINAMKRSIGPGAKVPLKELYEQYGKKHGIAKGTEFVEWLKNVKLKDSEKWKIVVIDEASEVTKTITGDNNQALEEKTGTESQQTQLNFKQASTNVAPMVQSKMTVADLVGMSVRQARTILPDIRDLNLLKYALQEANQLTGKDSLCLIIRKRIKEMQLAR